MKFKNIAFIVVALVIGSVAGRFMMPRTSSLDPIPSADVNQVALPTIWTCSMHPQIQQPQAGNCPICGMDLIPLENDVDADLEPRSMSMSEASKALAEIQTTAVIQDYPETQIRLAGKLEYDETRVKSLSARFPARIDELYVNFNGIRVNKGEHLAKVYSPQLLSAQRELLTAYRADPKSPITRAAREKLRLWDLLPDQIESIIQSNQAKDHFVLKAPVGGIVVEKKVKEGDYVETGEPLFRIVDLDVLWANLDAYESDLQWLRYGQHIELSVEAMPGIIYHAQIAFIEPEVNRKTRTVPVRINVPNGDGQLKPGMFVRGIVSSRLAAGAKVYAPALAGKWISPMHPEVIKDEPGVCDVCGMDLVPVEELGYINGVTENAPLIIPSSAVLRTGKRAVVYVEQTNSERPTYEGREIVLGPRAGDYFLVASGLSLNERVVTKGAFKIDSALQIQAKPSMMNPASAESSGVHHHNNSADPHAAQQMPPAIELTLEQAVRLLKPYLALQSALASDDLGAAKAQAKVMMKITGHSGTLPTLIHRMLDADSLDAIRKPDFETLSNWLIQRIESDPKAFEQDLYRMNCSMVYPDRGADWIQADDQLLNPYWGTQMLHCGTVEGLIE